MTVKEKITYSIFWLVALCVVWGFGAAMLYISIVASTPSVPHIIGLACGLGLLTGAIFIRLGKIFYIIDQTFPPESEEYPPLKISACGCGKIRKEL